MFIVCKSSFIFEFFGHQSASSAPQAKADQTDEPHQPQAERTGRRLADSRAAAAFRMCDRAFWRIGIAHITRGTQRIIAVLETVPVVIDIVITNFGLATQLSFTQRIIAVLETVAIIVNIVITDFGLTVQGIGTCRVFAVLEAVAVVIDTVMTDFGKTGRRVVTVRIITVDQAVAIVIDLVMANLFLAVDRPGTCRILTVRRPVLIVVDMVVTDFGGTRRQVPAPGIVAIDAPIPIVILTIATIRFGGVHRQIRHEAANKTVIDITDDRIAIEIRF